MQNKAIILLSGGLDSSLSLLAALKNTQNCLVITFDYQQISAKKEINAARSICRHYKTPLQIVKLPFFNNLGRHPLFNKKAKCPTLDINKLNHKKTTKQTAKSVWVPNRNGIFLNVAAGLAEARSIKSIYVGFNIEEAATFNDNSLAFIKAINLSLTFSTLNRVQIKCPTIKMKKSEILKRLIKNNFPINLLWSCYKNNKRMCGKCESCQRLKRAMLQNNLQTCMNKLFE